MPYSFKKFIAISFGLHLAIFLVFFLKPDWLKFPEINNSKVRFVQLTKGTGEKPDSAFKKTKDMPYWTVKEQKEALKDITKPKEKAKDKTTVKSEIKKKIPKEATKKQKFNEFGGVNFTPKNKPKKDTTIDDALARIQSQLDKREVEMEAAQIEKDGTGQSQFGSYDVEQGELDKELAIYFSEIKGRINRQWITAPKQAEEGPDIRCVINLNIDSEGNIVSTAYDSSSGDTSFDLSAMRAVERAAPFPPPPASIQAEVVREGFLIEFNPRSIVGNF